MGRTAHSEDCLTDAPLLPFAPSEMAVVEPRGMRNRKGLSCPLWTENKALLIQEYIKLFTYVTKHGAYIDGFAAPQRRNHAAKCSAKLVLENKPPWVRDFWLCDIDLDGIALLEQIKAANQMKGRRIEVLPGDFNTTVDTVLERIIAASSAEGATVLDPFCGCGTAVHAAQKLGRQWIGIDVTHLAISLIEKRLRAAFPGVAFTVEGTPKDLASAQDLAARDKYQFQWWAVSMVDAMPFGGKKKGADGGIDGVIYFKPDGKRTERAIVSVKGGLNPSVTMVETLAATIERERAPVGILLMNALPTREMERRAAAVGRFDAPATGKTYPRLQIITLAELFRGKKPDLPLIDPGAAFRKAAREETARQDTLL